MKYLRVKNFEQLQHYKDRNPPWIKLYNSLLDDYEFSCLQDASKLHLIGIWLLASRTGNKIPADPKWIANKINATEKVDLVVLVKSGFVEEIQPLRSAGQDASDELADRLPRDRGETEERREEEDGDKSPPPCPHSEIIRLYHESLPTLQRVVESLWHGSDRAKDLAARWKENKKHQSLEFWEWFFAVVAENPHWMGENDRKWKADLGWLLKRKNFIKAVELGVNLQRADQ